MFKFRGKKSFVLIQSLTVLSLATLSGLALAAPRQVDPRATIETRIHEVINPELAQGESVQIMSTADGRVYEVAGARKGLVASLVNAQAKNVPVSLTLDAQERVIGVADLPSPEAAKYSDILSEASGVDTSVSGAASESALAAPLNVEAAVDAALSEENASSSSWIPDNKGLGYRATNLRSMSEAARWFNSFPMLDFKSECYQRAHYWAYHMYSSGSVYSMKNFLFFTSSFVKRNKYKWWFHVAPMVYVQGQEIMLDADFGITGPKTVQDWTDFFMMDERSVRAPVPSHPVCVEVAKYSDYRNNQEIRDCYTLKLPMYYYQPVDAENLEDDGTRKSEWNNWDVKHSRKCFKRFWNC